MKKFLVLFFLAVLFIQDIQAQTPYPPPPPQGPPVILVPVVRRYKIGFQIAPDLDWFNAKSNNINNGGTKIGFGFGPTFEYDFAPNYGFYTGINIAHTSGELTYKNPTQFNTNKDSVYAAGADVKYNVEYIEIPLLLKLKTNEIGYVTYFVQFGLMPGINISAKGDIVGESIHGANLTTDNQDMGPNTSIGNVSMVIGGGASYSLTTTTSFYGTLSFINGFINATHNPPDITGASTKAILNRVALTAGIMF